MVKCTTCLNAASATRITHEWTTSRRMLEINCIQQLLVGSSDNRCACAVAVVPGRQGQGMS